jgi:hypothetical protein
MSTQPDYEELAALLVRGSERPWRVEYLGPKGYPQRITNGSAVLIAETFQGPPPPAANAELIVAAVNALPALLKECARYREHSTVLNTIAWKIAVALGDVPPGAEQVEGSPVAQAERLVAELEAARAERDMLGRQQQAILDLAHAADAAEDNYLTTQAVYGALITVPADAGTGTVPARAPGGPVQSGQTVPIGPEAEHPCPRCGSDRWVSVSLDEGYTRRAQCIPCGHVHAALGPGRAAR